MQAMRYEGHQRQQQQQHSWICSVQMAAMVLPGGADAVHECGKSYSAASAAATEVGIIQSCSAQCYGGAWGRKFQELRQYMFLAASATVAAAAAAAPPHLLR
jgi:hypothetical protein